MGTLKLQDLKQQDAKEREKLLTRLIRRKTAAREVKERNAVNLLQGLSLSTEEK